MAETAAHTPRLEVKKTFKLGSRLYRTREVLSPESLKLFESRGEMPKLLEMGLVHDAALVVAPADRERQELLERIRSAEARLDELSPAPSPPVAPAPESGDDWAAESTPPEPPPLAGEPPRRRRRRVKPDSEG